MPSRWSNTTEATGNHVRQAKPATQFLTRSSTQWTPVTSRRLYGPMARKRRLRRPILGLQERHLREPVEGRNGVGDRYPMDAHGTVLQSDGRTGRHFL